MHGARNFKKIFTITSKKQSQLKITIFMQKYMEWTKAFDLLAENGFVLSLGLLRTNNPKQ
jgi:hypothetical protein